MNERESKGVRVYSRNQEPLREFYQCRLKRGLKISNKRSWVIEYFINRDRHYSVEELYDEIKRINPRVSFSTVYRTLKLLSNCGLACECNFGDGIIRFEPVHKEKHHDHLICRRCGKIIEFENEEIEKIQRDIARKYTFLISSHRMELYGLCRDCQTKQRRK